jgi:hypothetical protein
MNCDCESDDGPPEVYHESKPKAKKRHICDDCYGIIQVGERYRRSFGIQHRDTWAHKRCADCQHMIHEVERRFLKGCGGSWCVYDGALADQWDSLAADPEPEIAAGVREVVAMQNAVCKSRGGSQFWVVPRWAREES